MISPQYGYDYTGRPYYPPMQPAAYPQPVMPQQQQGPPTPPPIRSGGIVSVPNEETARSYPVAPGVTVTMRDESGPFLYEKTMGYSQLEPPIFRKARIVFEDTARQSAQEAAGEPQAPAAVYAEIEQLEALRGAVVDDIRDLQARLEKETAEIRALVAAMIKPEPEKRTTRKKEAEEE